MVSLASENAKLEARIEAAKKKNADQGKELFKTPDEFPLEVSALISCLQIASADLRFLQVAQEFGKAVEVQKGPFASLGDRRVATAIQQSIVLWSTAIFGFSYPKLQTIKTYLEMLIAIIDAEQLLHGHPDCAKAASKYPVAFADLVKRVKNAAGMYLCTSLCCPYACSDSVSLADRAVGRHRPEMRDALIELFQKPIPDSFKAGRMVMEEVLGRPIDDKPVFCFASNPVLAAMVKPGKSVCVWETKAGYELVVRTTDTAG